MSKDLIVFFAFLLNCLLYFDIKIVPNMVSIMVLQQFTKFKFYTYSCTFIVNTSDYILSLFRLNRQTLCTKWGVS